MTRPYALLPPRNKNDRLCGPDSSYSATISTSNFCGSYCPVQAWSEAGVFVYPPLPVIFRNTRPKRKLCLSKPPAKLKPESISGGSVRLHNHPNFSHQTRPPGRSPRWRCPRMSVAGTKSILKPGNVCIFLVVP